VNEDFNASKLAGLNSDVQLTSGLPDQQMLEMALIEEYSTENLMP